jgi:hypothetical protein
VSFRPEAPREWVTFLDPDDDQHEVRADLSFLLSRWTCIYGQGCQGIVGRPGDGCCSHGAYFTDRADEKRVRAMARELTADDWHRFGSKKLAVDDDLEGEPARKTATVDGACVYANPADSAMGGGCALHRMALRTGRHPLETKPDVCWQVPISRKEEVAEDGRRTTTITEFSRRSWGEGGADLTWWCTEARSAHVGTTAMYRSYGPELTALVGQAAYDQLVKLCRRREKGARIELPLVKA